MENPRDNTGIYTRLEKAFEYATETYLDTIQDVNPFNDVLTEMHITLSDDFIKMNQITNINKLFLFTDRIIRFTAMCYMANRFNHNAGIEINSAKPNYYVEEIDEEGNLEITIHNKDKKIVLDLPTNHDQIALN